MSSPALPVLQQFAACFAVHAMVQVPLLAAAAWCAVALGTPKPNTAYRIWCGTLLLCLMLPAWSTWFAVSAALHREREHAEVRLDAGLYLGALPAFRRESAWMRICHHVSGRDGLRPVTVAMPRRYTRAIALSYCAVTLFFALRLALLWRRTRTLMLNGTAEAVPAAILNELHSCCAVLDIPVPRCRMTSGTHGPAIAGVVYPTLLLPETAREFSPQEIRAVLAHELAHLRRRDPLLHAVCTWLLVPVSFHPVAWWIGTRIRHTREMACDAEAAHTLGSAAEYAGALLRVAESTMPPSSGRWSARGLETGLLGMFNARGTMEERMNALVSGKNVMRGRAARVAASVTVAIIAVLNAGVLQVQPALAHERAVTEESAHLQSSTNASAAPDSTSAQAGGVQEQSGSAVLQTNGTASQSVHKPANSAATSMDVERSFPEPIKEAAIRAQTDALQQEAAKLQEQMNAPAWKAQMEKQHQAMEQMRTLMASPAWKEQQAKQRQAMEQMQAVMNAPEWKAQIKAQQELAAKLAAQYDSPEWKAQMYRQRELAATMQAQMQSPALRASIDAAQKMANDQVARVSMFADLSPFKPLFTAPPEGAPLKISSGVLAGNNTHKENPLYPPNAKQKGVQGAVVLHVLVSETGSVDQISAISSPDTALTQSAIDAVKQWTYKPFLLNGNAVPVESTVTVNYSLAK